MVGSIQCGIFNLYGQVAGRDFFLHWVNRTMKRKGKKIRIHYQNKRTKICSYSRPQEFFLLRRKDFYILTFKWLPTEELAGSLILGVKTENCNSGQIPKPCIFVAGRMGSGVFPSIVIDSIRWATVRLTIRASWNVTSALCYSSHHKEKYLHTHTEKFQQSRTKNSEK